MVTTVWSFVRGEKTKYLWTKKKGKKEETVLLVPILFATMQKGYYEQSHPQAYHQGYYQQAGSGGVGYGCYENGHNPMGYNLATTPPNSGDNDAINGFRSHHYGLAQSGIGGGGGGSLMVGPGGMASSGTEFGNPQNSYFNPTAGSCMQGMHLPVGPPGADQGIKSEVYPWMKECRQQTKKEMSPEIQGRFLFYIFFSYLSVCGVTERGPQWVSRLGT